jgi:O-antigen/teichoic acid export membrane protein
MKDRLRRFFKTDLFKASVLNGFASLIRILAGLVSNKVVAVTLGPSGIALLGQFQSYANIIKQFGTLGINNGVTKYVAEYHDNPELRSEVLSTALWMTVAATLITTIVTGFFYRTFCTDIVGTQEYALAFLVLSLTLILFTFNALFASILNGFKEFRRLIAINISTSLFGLAITIAMVLRYGLLGAFLGLVLSTSVVFFLALAFVLRSPWFQWHIFTSRISTDRIKDLLRYSVMSFVSLFAVSYVQLRLRTYMITHLSATEAGLWQGIVKISEIYLLFITTTLSVYYLPRLSEIKESHLLRKEIFRVYKFLVPLVLSSSLMVFLLRDYITIVLFSPSFLPMRDLFAFQLCGNIFMVCSWLVGYLMIAKAMVVKFIISELAYGLLNWAMTVLFLKHYGLVGATYSYFTLSVLYFIVMLFIFRKILFPRNAQ